MIPLFRSVVVLVHTIKGRDTDRKGRLQDRFLLLTSLPFQEQVPVEGARGTAQHAVSDSTQAGVVTFTSIRGNDACATRKDQSSTRFVRDFPEIEFTSRINSRIQFQ